MVMMYYLELVKMKRRNVFLPIILLLSVAFIWMNVVITKNYSTQALTRNLQHVIYTITAINSVILPLLFGTFASKISEVEHIGHTRYLLVTSRQTIAQLYLAKLLVIDSLICILALAESIFIYLQAQRYQLVSEGNLIAKFFIGFILASVLISMLHLYLSMYYPKQTLGIVLSLVGAFLGILTSGMLPRWVQFVIPWQFYFAFLPIKLENYNFIDIKVWSSYICYAILLGVIGGYFSIKKLCKEGKIE